MAIMPAPAYCAHSGAVEFAVLTISKPTPQLLRRSSATRMPATMPAVRITTSSMRAEAVT